ncbi:MAG: NADH-quinone oxidoreductase subunit J, partial [Oscillochloris sp.]|nr:NADH-quinone oxidoreductase subunit J [Oscillochloris sp.]
TLIGYVWNLPVPTGPVGTPEPLSGVEELGRGFVSEFVLHFEVAGVLLTVALIGAIVIAFEERSRRRRVLTLAEELELRKRREVSEQAPVVAAKSAD